MSTRRTRSSMAVVDAPSSEKRQTRSIVRARSRPVQTSTNPESVGKDEDGEVVLSSQTKQRHLRRGNRDISREVEEDSDDDIQPSTIKGRARVRHSISQADDNSDAQSTALMTPLKCSSRQEQVDINEDLEDLRSSGNSSLRECLSMSFNAHRRQNRTNSRQGCFSHKE